MHFLTKIFYKKEDFKNHALSIILITGKITHDPEASIEKITRQKLKYPPVEKIGFQLLGMRVYLYFI